MRQTVSDLIERDKVIEYCLKLIDVERKQGSDVMNYGQERINQTDTIIAFVENLPSARQQGEWIPCSERLPEVGETVLTFDGSCICVERRIEWMDTPEGQLDGEWWIDGYDGDEYNPINLRDGTAIAWMPLPELWKGADDENR